MCCPPGCRVCGSFTFMHTQGDSRYCLQFTAWKMIMVILFSGIQISHLNVQHERRSQAGRGLAWRLNHGLNTCIPNWGACVQCPALAQVCLCWLSALDPNIQIKSLLLLQFCKCRPRVVPETNAFRCSASHAVCKPHDAA